MKSDFDLSKFRRKRVNVVDRDGDSYTGKVTSFMYGKDNDSGEDAIVIDNSVWLDKSDISEIKEI